MQMIRRQAAYTRRYAGLGQPASHGYAAAQLRRCADASRHFAAASFRHATFSPPLSASAMLISFLIID